MTGAQNWAIDLDAKDYFTSQQKQLDLADRRPVIRRAGDLVGPGIAAEAVRITDFRDELATFNGYYSAAPDALDSPDSTSAFIGSVIGDPLLGGEQSFRSLQTDDLYTRTFIRAVGDPSAITWGEWRRQLRVVPAMDSLNDLSGNDNQEIAPGFDGTVLTPPPLTGVNTEGFYNVGSDEDGRLFSVTEQGVYGGLLFVTTYQANNYTLRLSLTLPGGNLNYFRETPTPKTGVSIPFSFIFTGSESASIVLSATHTSATPQQVNWRDFAIQRIGDAV